tara:strand:- start:691 stop:3621 length:2931 start_codon:yes stop_codon:yes gene_type:complete
MALCLTKDSTQRKNFKEVMKVVAGLTKDPLIKKFDGMNSENFEFLWHRYTGKPWDPTTVHIDKGDAGVFKAGVMEWRSTLGKRQGWFSQNVKLPVALARNIKGGNELVQAIGESMSYNQRQIQEGGRHVKVMIDGLYSMFTESFTKSGFKEFQNLEAELMNAITPKEKTEALRKLTLFTETTEGGKILTRYNKLLDGTTLPKTPTENTIVSEWNVLRVESMKNLLNGAISARRLIQSVTNEGNRKHLMNAYEKVQDQIDALLVSSKMNFREFNKNYKSDGEMLVLKNESDLKVFNPYTKTYEKYQKYNGEGEYVVGLKQYSPKYVIELTDIMHQIASFAKSDNKSIDWKNMTPAQVEAILEKELSPENVVNRLKIAGETDKYYSLDPVYYLNKYVNDVASFNLRSRINLNYHSAMKPLLESIRSNNLKGGDKDVGAYSKHLLEIMTEIKDSALYSNGSPTSAMDNMVRTINAFEYASKLGFSVRGALKNRTQAFNNWIFYGTRGYRITRDFKNQTSREYDSTTDGKEQTNEAMINRQKKRFGMLMGVKEAAGTVSAATKGSMDVILIPEGFDVNNRGQLIRSTKGETSRKIADKFAKGADKFSTFMKWAENRNRIETFDMAFAHAFMGEKTRLDYHKKQLEQKLGKAPTTKQLYDHIETTSGNMAFEMVKKLHFDYDNWAKARILQGRAGKVIGQYQHFKWAFFDLHYNMVKDLVRDVKGFRFTERDPLDPSKMIVSQSFTRMFRAAALYSVLPGLFALVSDADVGGLASVYGITPFEEDQKRRGSNKATVSIIENPIMEESSKLLQFLGNMNHSGDADKEKQYYDSYYGKGPIVANLGPFLSDVITAAEITDFLNLTSDEYEEHKKLNYNPDDSDWWYQVGRIFNIQGSRTFWKTMPALAKGQWEKAFRIETGMFKPKWITKWRDKQKKKLFNMTYNSTSALPNIDFERGSKRKTKNQKELEKEKTRLAALAALS